MYDHQQIEKKWQKYWAENDVFATPELASKRPKFYVLDMFPYPSGQGLHVGHLEGYTASDIVARFKRLKGFDVLHPIGWDAFGLPAEQFAIQTGQLPQKFTPQNIANFRRQLQMLGFSYDYAKEVNTTDPDFYAQTQAIFSALYQRGMAEMRDVQVNWSPDLGTVLANEEVLQDEQGRPVSERGHFPVVKKAMRQWVLKITAYADRLYQDLDLVDWPSSLVNLQRNWIKNPDGSLHLRDWVFSRQRYWGEPFPILHGPAGQIKLDQNLPVVLPLLEEIKPGLDGQPPLANADPTWLWVELDGRKWRRETNTMPQWAGSSWYYLAYILKKRTGGYLALGTPAAQKVLKRWLPVDLYIGGQEHAVLHLLYARFWHKVLYDLKLVPTKEPFAKVVNQGMILGPDRQKMSKSRGNVISPDQIVFTYGADALRLYEMFSGPLEETKTWSTRSLRAMRKWLDRVWNLVQKTRLGKSKVSSEYHLMLKQVSQLIDQLKFNVAISKLMVFVNALADQLQASQAELVGLAVVLSLFAPHLAEEILVHLKAKPLDQQTWPVFDQRQIRREPLVLAVQVNGKLRATLELEDSQANAELVRKQAAALPSVSRYLKGAKVAKVVYVAGKIVNFVLRPASKSVN